MFAVRAWDRRRRLGAPGGGCIRLCAARVRCLTRTIVLPFLAASCETRSLSPGFSGCAVGSSAPLASGRRFGTLTRLSAALCWRSLSAGLSGGAVGSPVRRAAGRRFGILTRLSAALCWRSLSSGFSGCAVGSPVRRASGRRFGTLTRLSAARSCRPLSAAFRAVLLARLCTVRLAGGLELRRSCRLRAATGRCPLFFRAVPLAHLCTVRLAGGLELRRSCRLRAVAGRCPLFFERCCWLACAPCDWGAGGTLTLLSAARSCRSLSAGFVPVLLYREAGGRLGTLTRPLFAHATSLAFST